MAVNLCSAKILAVKNSIWIKSFCGQKLQVYRNKNCGAVIPGLSASARFPSL